MRKPRPPAGVRLGEGVTTGAAVAALALGPGVAGAQVAQNPSPMVETARAHERVERRELPGIRFDVEGVLPRPVRVYAPEAPEPGAARLVVHFHGAPYVAEAAAHGAPDVDVVAAVHLGAGSSAYEKSFRRPGTFDDLVAAIRRELARRTDPEPRGGGAGGPAFASIRVSAFSAGYGAVRALLRAAGPEAPLDGLLLLDGLHAGYLPPRTPLAEGGRLDAGDLEPFVAYARRAARGEGAMLVTHSEIFPGTFASTTETADHLLRELGIERRPVLRWGPVGMQQISEARRGRLRVMGFAGNTAPDHIDHLHGLGWFLERLPRREGGGG